MQNTKIIQFLKSLSKAELRDFGKFVNSPFHNNRKDVVKYYDLLKNYYPDFKFELEPVFKRLYPGKAFDPNTLNLLNAYLYSLGRDFLAVKELKENSFSSRQFLLEGLDKHQADGLFEKELKHTQDFLQSEKLNIELLRNKYLTDLLKINFNLKRNRQEKTCQISIDYSDNMIYYFLLNLAENYHGLLANKMSFNFDFEDSVSMNFIKNFDFENFVKSIDKNKTENYEFILFYYYLFMCIRYPDNDSYFLSLKEYSFIDFERLSDAEKSDRFNYLIDYCIYKMEMGNLNYLRESFNLYDEALKKRLFQSSAYDRGIGLIFFRNFVTIGLAAKEYDYIEKFLAEYGDRIKTDNKNDLLELSYSMLNYEKKEYEKALECLSKVSNSIPLFRLSTKYILLKIYYDTNQYDSFFSLIDTYRHYLKNDKIIPNHTREVHTLLLVYAGRLAKIKVSGDYGNSLILKKEIKNDMKLDFRHKLWLTEKAAELEK